MADEWLDQLPPLGSNKPEAKKPIPLPEEWINEDLTETPRAVNLSLGYAFDKNPDAYAQTLKAAQSLNIPIDVAERNAKEVTSLKKQRDTYSVLSETKSLKKAFENPDFAAVAQDDVDTLAEIERVAKFIKKGYVIDQFPFVKALERAAEVGPSQAFDEGIEMAKGIPEFATKAPSRVVGGLAQAPYMVSEYAASVMDYFANMDRAFYEKLGIEVKPGEHILEKLSAPLKGAGDVPLYESPMIKALFDLENIRPDIPRKGPADWWREGAMGSTETVEAALQGVESLGAMAPGTLLSIATGTAGPALTMGYLQEGGQFSKEAREKGLSPEATFYGASTQGLIEAATEKLPMMKLLEDLKVGTSFGKTLIKQILLEVPQEQAATILQDFNSWAMLRPEATFGDFLSERPSAAYQTLIATLTGTGIQTTASYGTMKAIERITGQAYPEVLGESSRAQRALEREGLAQAITRLAEDTNLRQRLPEVYQKYVEELDVDNVYIDGDEFFQLLEKSGITPEDVQIKSVQDQIEYIRENGGDFQIPLSEYMTYIAGSEISESITEHVRFDPDDMSASQARTWEKEVLPEMLQEESEQVLSNLEEADAFVQSANNVEKTIREDLIQTGRMTTDAAQKSAAIHKAMAVTISSRYPQLFPLPEDFHKKYGLKIAGQPITGMKAFEQVRNIQEIIADPEYQAARERAYDGEETINIARPEREQLRQQLAVDLYGDGAAKKESKAWIILGPPAAGKSTIAQPLAQEQGAMIVDADIAKEALPEYENGIGANRVHQESKVITADVLRQAITNKDNIVLPLVGSDYTKIARQIEMLKERGYTVGVRLVDLNIDETFRRSIERWQQTGRFIPAEYILDTVGRKPATVYQRLIKEGVINDYEAYTSDVPKGEAYPKIEDIDAHLQDEPGRTDVESRRPDRDGAQEVTELFQEQPTFFSGLEKAVSELKQEKGSAQQFLAQIKKTPGVKQEEIEWLSLEEYLAGKEKITKQEILDFVQQNGVQVEEVNKGEERGEKRPISLEEAKEILADNPNAYVTLDNGGRIHADRIDLINEDQNLFVEEGREQATKFSQWQLPGGENYRELLLTLPPTKKVLEQWQVLRPNGISDGIYSDAENAQKRADEIGGTVKQKDTLNLDSGFRSGHFGELNILAHVRFNERTDAEGKRVLFIEEVQSDWHQKGRKEGYKKEQKFQLEDTTGWTAKHDKKNHRWTVRDSNRRIAFHVPDHDVTNEQEAIRGAAEVTENLNKVPDAPFKTTWPLLAMKRMIRYAAENGFDSIAWTTGEQQAERYNLANYVETIKHTKNSDGTYNLYVVDKEGKDVLDRLDIPEDELENLIGKEMAQKIVNREGEPEVSEALQGILDRGRGLEVFNGEMITLGKGKYSNSVGLYYKDNRIKDFEPTGGMTQEQGERYLDRIKNRWFIAYEDGSVAGTYVNEDDAQRAMDNINRDYFDSPDKNQRRVLSGLDLKVGGEGMKSFYDKMLPSMVNKYVKKWGAKVGDTIIETEATGHDDPDTTEIDEEGMVARNIHSFDITESMRESVMEGQALFQEKRGKIQFPQDITQSPSVISLLENADLSTFLHETGHFFFEVYRDIASRPDAPERIFQDMDALVKFAGVQNLDEWNSLSHEQRRAGHEKVAEAFEVYLFEGKAPSVELQSLFQTFRAWLVNVYRQLRQYLSPDKITDEVRGVFDRMLATDDAIRHAENVRKMMPMFGDKEQAGATDEEWSRYQNNLLYAHEGAIEEVQARSLKDMQWLSGAKSRELKKLQSKANTLRNVVKEEVTNEVMDLPVYRTMYLLRNGKLPRSDAEQVPVNLDANWLKDVYGGIDLPKSDPNIVNPQMDELLIAIAKYGGINQSQAQAEGIDQETWKGKNANTINQPVFGKRIFRKDGRSLDAIAEQLKQDGYLMAHEDANDLFNKLTDSLSGHSQYSSQVNYDLMFPQEQTVPWQKLVQSKMASYKDGVDPDIFATSMGFSSGDAMVRAILTAPKQGELIKQMTDQRMLERHAEYSNPAALQEAADKAVHNLARAKVVSTEARFINKLINQTSPDVNAAKNAAARRLGDMQIKDIKPARFEAEEKRATKDMIKSWKEDDLEGAAWHSQRRLLNFQLATQAREAIDKYEKIVTNTNKYNKESVRKKMRGEHLEQIDRFLERFDFRKSVSLKQIEKSLHEYVQSESARLSAVTPDINSVFYDESYRKHYKTMTLNELIGFNDALRQLEMMARREHKMYTEVRNQNFEEEIGGILQELRAIHPRAFDEDGNPKKYTKYTKPIIKDIREKLSSKFDAEFLNIEFLLDSITVGKGKQVFESLFGRVSDAADEQALFMRDLAKFLRPNTDAFSVKERMEFSTKRIFIPEIGQYLTRDNMLTIALYNGSPEGRQRLLDGNGYTEAGIRAILNRLDKRDVDLANAIWTMNDFMIWPRLKALNERTRGIAPPKVEAVPVMTKNGLLTGGYVPLVRDGETSNRSYDINTDQAVTELLGGTPKQARTAQGASEKRLEKANYELEINIAAITYKINETVHDIAFREAIADTWKLMNSSKLGDAIRNIAGPDVYATLKERIRESAVKPIVPRGFTEKFLWYLRKNTLVGIMGASVQTVLVNVLGASPAMNYVGPSNYLRAITKFTTKDAMKRFQYIIENSSFMRERFKNVDRDMSAEMNRFTIKGGIMPDIATWFIGLSYMDRIVTLPLWWAQHEKSMQSHGDKKTAIMEANRAVRETQGSGRVVDLARISGGTGTAGEFKRILTMFYSFFNAQLGLMVKGKHIADYEWSQGNHAKAVARVTLDTLAVIIIPSVLEMLARDMIYEKGECDDSDYFYCGVRATALFTTSFFPIIRDIIPAAWSQFDPSMYRPVRISPVEGAMEAISAMPKAAFDIATGEENETDYKRLTHGLGYMFGLPGVQTWRTIEGYQALVDGETDNPMALFTGAPK